MPEPAMTNAIGVFDPVPEKNTFGWYVLVREWHDRFEEVHKAPEFKNAQQGKY